MQLVPCGGCRRHVDVREVACPFCASPIVAARSQWFAPRGRITRAAVFSAALVACESKHDAPKPAPATAPQQQGSDDLEKMLDTDHRVVDHPAPPADASVAIDGAAVATAADAGVPVDAGMDQAKLKAEQDRRRRELLERRRKKIIEQNKVVVPVDPNYHNIPKPYGAPPARRRVV